MASRAEIKGQHHQQVNSAGSKVSRNTGATLGRRRPVYRSKASLYCVCSRKAQQSHEIYHIDSTGDPYSSKHSEIDLSHSHNGDDVNIVNCIGPSVTLHFWLIHHFWCTCTSRKDTQSSRHSISQPLPLAIYSDCL